MTPTRITIIDYGMGNIRSVRNAFVRLGCDVHVAETAEEMAGSTALVLPGVGAFAEAMSNLHQCSMVAPLQQAVAAGTPLLGICLGMQLLADSSEERGETKGLGLIPGRVRRIPVGADLRLPHVGWNEVVIQQRQPLFTAARDGESFYFVHTYYFDCSEQYRAATTDYGSAITAAVQKDHVMGVQFHPERSQNSGLKLLNGFVEMVREREAVC